jgi:hypothetical protein
MEEIRTACQFHLFQLSRGWNVQTKSRWATSRPVSDVTERCPRGPSPPAAKASMLPDRTGFSMTSSMRRTFAIVGMTAWLGLAATLIAAADSPAPARRWASSLDRNLQLTEQPTLGWITPAAGHKTAVAKVDPVVGFQTRLGMGSSLEPSTCWNLSRLTPAERDQVMERLVKPMIGGELLPQNYAADAEYFASFIQADEAEGIRIWPRSSSRRIQRPRNSRQQKSRAQPSANANV